MKLKVVFRKLAIISVIILFVFLCHYSYQTRREMEKSRSYTSKLLAKLKSKKGRRNVMEVVPQIVERIVPRFQGKNHARKILVDDTLRRGTPGMDFYNLDDMDYYDRLGPISHSSDPRLEITSVYRDICARYGSGNLPNNIIPSKWCDIGSVIIDQQLIGGGVPYTAFPFSARYVSSSTPSGWQYRIYDKINGTYIFLPDSIVGTGSWRTLRDGDIIKDIPGKPGRWKVQLQMAPSYVYAIA